MAILIISNYNDPSTDIVIDWIIFKKKVPFRLTYEDFIQDFNVSKKLFNNESSQTIIYHKKTKFHIESAWFRSETNNDFQSKYFKKIINNFELNGIQKYLRFENIKAKQLFLGYSDIRWLSEFDISNINKFHTLNKAKILGLKIPETLITNNKPDILSFLRKHKNTGLILKSIGENLSLLIENKTSFFQPIKVINEKSVNNLPDFFMPSLFQEKINKEFDLRVFYLNGVCYSMSIHTNKDDYREGYMEACYNPFQLPKSICIRVHKLMKTLKLNIGCIDFVKEKASNNYYFLEINPNGQFGFVSSFCNYKLEQEIAKYLCHEN